MALRLSALLVIAILWAPSAYSAITAETVRRGKSSTALVIVSGTRDVSGSAFCVNASGYFITCDHVVRGKQAGEKVNMIIDPGQETQREVDAVVVRFDHENDLAVLRVEGEENLNILPLGETANLIETAEVVAFGYPFGTALSTEANNYPSVSVNVGRITSLRKKEGQLETIQTDVAVNPGNSGGPILDSEGNVVGIVNAQFRGASGVNFAVPVERASELLAAPDITWQAPTIAYVDRHRENDVEITVRPLMNGNMEYLIEVQVQNGDGQSHVYTAEQSENGYTARLVPIPAKNGPLNLPVRIRYEHGVVQGLIAERTIDFGEGPVVLAEIHRLQRERDQWRAETANGSSNAAPIKLGKASVDLGGQMVEVNLDAAAAIDVDQPEADWGAVPVTISVSTEGKMVGELSTQLIIDPPLIDDKIKPGVPMKGKFYVNVDDRATIHVRGKEINCGLGPTASDLQELALGDVMVVELHDIGGNRHFGIVFVSEDGRFVVSFRAEDFRVIPDKTVAEINADIVRNAENPGVHVATDIQFPVPPNTHHRSRFIWGENKSSCIIATIIRPEMLRRGK